MPKLDQPCLQEFAAFTWPRQVEKSRKPGKTAKVPIGNAPGTAFSGFCAENAKNGHTHTTPAFSVFFAPKIGQKRENPKIVAGKAIKPGFLAFPSPKNVDQREKHKSAKIIETCRFSAPGAVRKKAVFKDENCQNQQQLTKLMLINNVNY